MNKILLGLCIAAQLFSTTISDEDILHYEENRLLLNPSIDLHDVKIGLKKSLPNGWYGYVFNVDLTHKGKKISTNDILFFNGTEITNTLMSIKGQDYKSLLHPTLGNKFYSAEYLIAGTKDSKHKIVIFSEPLCPACVNVLPKYIEEINSNPKDLALYYIPMPLSIHPTSTTIVKAAFLAKENGMKDVNLKLYQGTSKLYTSGNKTFNPSTEDNDLVALEFFNNLMGTNFSLNDLNIDRLKNKVLKSLTLAEEAFVKATPTIFFDGEIDPFREKHKKFVKLK